MLQDAAVLSVGRSACFPAGSLAHLVCSLGIFEHIRHHTLQGTVNSDPELARRQGRHLGCRLQALPYWPAVSLSASSGDCLGDKVLL